MDFFKNTLGVVTDKVGDATIYVLDEMKFWGEVIVDFFELDGGNSDEALEEYRKTIREHMEETEKIKEAIDRSERERALDNNEISEGEDVENTEDPTTHI